MGKTILSSSTEAYFNHVVITACRLVRVGLKNEPMHGACGSLPSAIDGNLHTQLPTQLAHSGPVTGGFDITQDPPPQPLRLPGAQTVT